MQCLWGTYFTPHCQVLYLSPYFVVTNLNLILYKFILQLRFALSVFWELTEDGAVVSTWYGRTVIRSSYQVCVFCFQQNLQFVITNGANSPDAFLHYFGSHRQLKATLWACARHFQWTRKWEYYREDTVPSNHFTVRSQFKVIFPPPFFFKKFFYYFFYFFLKWG